MIEYRGVSKRYAGGISALSQVDLFVGKGEFVFVIGPSGAGKSTLLRLAYRADVPSTGEVIVDGRNVAAMRPSQVPYLRRNIGVVFQDFKLLPSRTVYENIAFAMEVTGAKPNEIRRRAAQVLDLVGLRGRAKAFPQELSGGEQQRTCLARAMVNSPKILLADEPTGNLDPETGTQIMQALFDISLLGTTVVVATHAQTIVDSFRTRVVRLDRGEVTRDDGFGGYWGPLNPRAGGGGGTA